MQRLQDEIAWLNVHWIWNWGPNPPLFPGVESVPNIWSGATIGQPLGGNSEWLLTHNECEQADQCATAAEQVAREFAEIERIYPDRKLTSPQVVRWDLRSLEDVYAAYVRQQGHPPRFDALAIHTYLNGSLESYQEHVAYYIALAQRWGVPEVWITEFTIPHGFSA